jgi:hypothetical protein
MPALPDVPNVLRLVLHYIVGGDTQAIDRLYVGYTGSAPSDANCATIAGDVETAFGTDLKSLMYTGSELTGVVVTDLTTPTSGQGSSSTVISGTRTGGVLPANACVLQNSQINRRYRGGKPRTYWPFGTDTDLSSAQVWSGASITAFETGLNAFWTAVAAISVGGCTLGDQVNVSYYKGFTAVLNPITGRTRDVPNVRATAVVDTIQALTVNPHVASQRRRTLIRP